MADISKTVEIIFSGQDKTSAAIVGIGSNLDNLEKKFTRTGTVAGQTTDIWLDASGKWRNSAGQFASSAELAAAGVENIGKKSEGVSKATDALKALAASLVIKEFIAANSQLDTFRATLNVATGDLQTTNKLIDDLRGFANKVGVEFSAIAPSFSAFLSAAKGTAIEGQPAVEIFQAFGTALAAVGVSSADASGAFTQLAQGVSKGKFELDDLKSIAERLPGFFSKFAESLGVSTEELYKLISQGKIGIPELQKLSTTLQTTFEGTKFTTFNNELARLKNSLDELYATVAKTGVFEGLKFVIDKVALSIRFASESIGLFIKGVDIFSDIGNTGPAAAFNLWREAVDKSSESVKDIVPRLLGLQDRFAGLDEALIGISNGSLPKTAVVLDGIDMAAIDTANSLANVTKETKKTKDASAEAAKELAAQAKATLDAKKAADDYKIKMTEIASNQQIKLIEANVKLQIAEAQANAQIITGVINDLQETFSDTGSVISNIFGNLADIGGFYGLEKLQLIEDQLQKENEYRSEALQLQKDLTVATIANLNAKAQAMQAGNALIQIDGAGLQPHLEAFMWEILKTIQVRVNQDGLEMLVGV